MKLSQNKTTINLNNEIKLSIEDFCQLEPNFESLPDGYTNRLYEPGKIHQISGPNKSVINLDCNWTDGNRYLKRINDFKNYLKYKNSLETEYDENLVEMEKRKLLPYEEARKLEYPSIEDLTVALWEKIAENKTEKFDTLQELRIKIKNKYPKGD